MSNSASSEKIKRIKSVFLGSVITKEGDARYWGTDELDKQCASVLKKLTVEQKLEFLVRHGVIE